MKKQEIIINQRAIGPNEKPFVVGELSGNHNGDINRAFQLLEEAKKAGVDAVKIQTYTADTMTIDHDGDDFNIKGGLWDGYSLYTLYEEAHTPWEWHTRLFDKAKELGLTLFSTPFDMTSVDFLEELDVPAYKVASFECTDLNLIKRVAETGKPIIISTGMADLSEIAETVSVVREAGNENIILMHCVSVYPSNPEDANLRTIPHLSDTFDVMVGLSDHTMGLAVSVASISLGAVVVEKHFTLKRSDGGPDSGFSLEPDELTALVDGCHTAWSALGEISYKRNQKEESNLVFRRSLYVVEDVQAGESLTDKNIRSIRPGYGMSPKYYPEVIGCKALTNLKKGTPLTKEYVRWRKQ